MEYQKENTMRTFDSSDGDSGRFSAPEPFTGRMLSPRSNLKPKSVVNFPFGQEPVYDLRLGQSGSDCFYADVAAFSAKVVSEITRREAPALNGYSRYATETLREPPRSRGEYALELLTLGMALRLYGEVAAETPRWASYLAHELFWMRRRSVRMKPIADFLRAGLFQLFMRKKLSAPIPGPERDREDGLESRKDYPRSLPRLIEWLRATGEFERESRRIENWRGYLHGLPADEAQRRIAASLGLFDWFAREADLTLGTYTSGVARFLEKTCGARFWREDLIFCGRRAVEYHLGMVAAEVMNDGLRKEFQRKPRRVLLVPACMRARRSEDCQAVVRGLDITCTGCHPDCAVNRITRKMRAEGTPVYIVPHSTGFSRWLERWQNDPGVGVVAVACMLNILAGGYEMRDRRIASQCVPLDYPGCGKHWMSKDVPTAVNEARLVEIAAASRN